MKKHLALTAALGLAITLLACEDKEKKQTPAATQQPSQEAAAQPPTTLTDSRDNKTYKIVKIGEQVWMAENLNYNANGSKCYDNEESNCTTYGRLYNFETAKTACPSGWKLPTKAEWEVLVAAVGGKETAGKNLKAKSGWNNNGNGTDKFGFSALPSGFFGSEGEGYFFGNVGDTGFWWNSSKGSVIMGYNEESTEYGNYLDDSYRYSIRCIQN